MPWQQVTNPWSPLEVLSADQVEQIIAAALTILETTGFRFLDDESRRRLEAAGAESAGEDNMTRLDRAFVMENVANVPERFTLRARNPERNLTIRGNNNVYASVGGPAFVSELDKGRRPGTYAVMCD